MEAEKVDRKKLEKIPYLYRGDNEGHFCYRALSELIKGKKEFFGFLENGTRKITFCTPDLQLAILYGLRQLDDSTKSGFPRREYLSKFPLVMAINTHNYKKQIYVGEEGGCYIITGPIALDDIEILYSPHINKLKEFSVNYYNSKRFLKGLECLLRSLEHAIKTYNLKREDLIDRYEKNEKVREDLKTLLFPLQLRLIYENAKDAEDEKLESSISVLKKKLR